MGSKGERRIANNEKDKGRVRVSVCVWGGGVCVCLGDEGGKVFKPFSKVL